MITWSSNVYTPFLYPLDSTLTPMSNIEWLIGGVNHMYITKNNIWPVSFCFQFISLTCLSLFIIYLHPVIYCQAIILSEPAHRAGYEASTMNK